MFHDLITRRMIGSSRVKNDLYLLDSGEQVVHNIAVSNNKTDDIWLSHKRLGHPPFSLLQHLFLSDVLNRKVTKF